MKQRPYWNYEFWNKNMTRNKINMKVTFILLFTNKVTIVILTNFFNHYTLSWLQKQKKLPLKNGGLAAQI